MPELTVSTFRVSGFYRTRYGVNKSKFEKELRAISKDEAIASVKLLIGAQKVKRARIVINSVEEIKNPDEIKSRVVKAFATEKIRI
jgi:ribosomal protein L20A (L18A)